MHHSSILSLSSSDTPYRLPLLDPNGDLDKAELGGTGVAASAGTGTDTTSWNVPTNLSYSKGSEKACRETVKRQR